MHLTSTVPFATGGHSALYDGSLIGRRVAVKIPKSRMPESELRILQKLMRSPHHNVVACLAICEDQDPAWTVMEKMEGDLKDLLIFHAAERLDFPMQRVRSIMHQLLSGLAHLHHHRIMHCDVKPDNILLLADRVVVADFGEPLLSATDAQASRSGRGAASA